MGLLDFLKKRAVLPTQNLRKSTSELSNADKERITVERITLEDMKRVSTLPYIWNCDIKKNFNPGSHPFAYIDLSGDNINTARNEIQKMNQLLHEAQRFVPAISLGTVIPIEDIIFSSRTRGYTKLICTPHTFTGRPSKYPARLVFMTNLEQAANSTHGELFYGQSGNIERANIYCWKRGEGYFFFFKMVGGALTLYKIQSTVSMDARGLPAIIYKL